MRQWKVGDVTITKIVEMEVTGHTRFILPDALRDAVIGYDWLKPHFMDDAGNLIMSIHALVIETAARRIVVDTCIGNDKSRPVPRWDNLQTPFLDAGLVDLVAADHEVCDEVRLTPSHGHTPGHVSIIISSAGEEALIAGDFLHHPCQMARPDWCSSADVDRVAAVETRRRMFERYAGIPTLIIGTHFSGATAGRLIRDGEAYLLAV
jgi:hypothetical protein